MYHESFGGSDFTFDPSFKVKCVIDTLNTLYPLYFGLRGEECEDNF